MTMIIVYLQYTQVNMLYDNILCHCFIYIYIMMFRFFIFTLNEVMYVYSYLHMNILFFGLRIKDSDS